MRIILKKILKIDQFTNNISFNFKINHELFTKKSQKAQCKTKSLCYFID